MELKMILELPSLQIQFELNFKKKLVNLLKSKNPYKVRNLSLKGKIIVLNHLALSPLLYFSKFIFLPPEVINKVNKIIRGFIWDNKPPKVSQFRILKMVDLR